MAQLGISEFNFGYAFLFEKTTQEWGNLVSVPILPSLQEEAIEGWDAKLPLYGKAYYYQFKMSEYLARSSAKFIKDGTYQGPYYRIALHPKHRNQQHRRLRRLASQEKDTYYVAPEIGSFEEFRSSFLQKSIIGKSRLIPVNECEDIDEYDGSQHFITFAPNSPGWNFHSEKNYHGNSYSGEKIKRLYHESQDWKRIDEEFVIELISGIKTIVARMEDHEYSKRDFEKLFGSYSAHEEKKGEGINVLLGQLAEIVSFFFGATVEIIGGNNEISL